ncbi:MAG: aminoglycoside phosphotransferase family protein [Candidatus Rokubacteria bacterium]|nr:aminoglycoside phosphotransferase family protein [Candidatus Rokubacteria bacterium]
MSLPELTPAVLGASLGRALRTQIASLERLPGGRNSRIYRALDAGGRAWAVKVYVRQPGRRDSLATEFTALSFLHGHGIAAVPRPVARDEELGWAAYDFVDGAPVRISEVGDADILAAVEFLASLRELRKARGADELPAAAEAGLTVTGVVDDIERRMKRLRDVPDAPALQAFLGADLAPAIERMRAAAGRRLGRAGRAAHEPLAPALRTLSPSDFGFHNALRRPDGGLTFVDFEYFGWDDPAKMVSDFLLHPGMALTDAARATFAARIAGAFADDVDLPDRIEATYPLYGLKWCVILLNEFLGADLSRRQFAGGASDPAEVRATQLAKACRMLEKVSEDHERFPYRF